MPPRVPAMRYQSRLSMKRRPHPSSDNLGCGTPIGHRIPEASNITIAIVKLVATVPRRHEWARRAKGWFLEFRLIPVLLWSYTAVALGTGVAFGSSGTFNPMWFAVALALRLDPRLGDPRNQRDLRLAERDGPRERWTRPLGREPGPEPRPPRRAGSVVDLRGVDRGRGCADGLGGPGSGAVARPLDHGRIRARPRLHDPADCDLVPTACRRVVRWVPGCAALRPRGVRDPNPVPLGRCRLSPFRPRARVHRDAHGSPLPRRSHGCDRQAAEAHDGRRIRVRLVEALRRGDGFHRGVRLRLTRCSRPSGLPVRVRSDGPRGVDSPSYRPEGSEIRDAGRASGHPAGNCRGPGDGGRPRAAPLATPPDCSRGLPAAPRSRVASRRTRPVLAQKPRRDARVPRRSRSGWRKAHIRRVG